MSDKERPEKKPKGASETYEFVESRHITKSASNFNLQGALEKPEKKRRRKKSEMVPFSIYRIMTGRPSPQSPARQALLPLL